MNEIDFSLFLARTLRKYVTIEVVERLSGVYYSAIDIDCV